jgi:hypothetical protein
MAVQAGPCHHAVVGILSVEGLKLRIGAARMASDLVAALTELGGLSDQQASVVASVNLMAVQTVFFNRRVLEPERPSFFRMALVAELVDSICFDHLRSEAAMGVMAVRACYPSFPDRVMRLLIRLESDVFVAAEAEFGFTHFQTFPYPGVKRVAIGAGDAV